MLYPLQTSPGGHLFLPTQLVVSLGIPPLLALMPLWPIIFLPGHDEGEPLSHLLFCVVG
jgi:hypothetical protein